MGRWDYGPFALPPDQAAVFTFQPIANPYYDPVNAPWEPQLMPATPNPSVLPEAFMDTPLVNGAAYPYVQLGPHAYRFRILNACNDRTLNLQLYYASSNAKMWNGTTLLSGGSGEVAMVPALPTAGFPASWPTDGRLEGVPSPAAAGPSWIQIGTEGGLMPAPVVIPPQPVVYDTVNSAFGVVNIDNKSLFMMPAHRADVIVDFTGIPDGTKLILYNDAPAPAPGGDTRYDYFTNDTNQNLIGGAPTTFAGYGPNTRTIMQIQINASITGTGFNIATLNAQLPAAYAQFQDKPIVPQPAYNTAFGAAYPTQNINSLTATNFTFIPAGQIGAVTMDIQPKQIIGDFDMVYGRLVALLGTKQAAPYLDPPTEVFNNSLVATPIGSLSDGTQIWRVRNNDVDLHPLHWHMFNLQVINRVRWDGVVLPPDPNELGWKETISTPPLMDTIVAQRPITPNIPWELPNAIRPLDPTRALGSTQGFSGLDPAGGQAPVVNRLVNFGWEYVFHCHILGHEEFDFMRPMAVAVAPPVPPSGLTVRSLSPTSVNLTWVDTTISETNWTVQRAPNATAGPWTDLSMFASTTGPQKGATVSYIDATQVANTQYYYRVMATNIVGDFTPYPGTVGYPYLIVNSSPSNTASLIKQTRIGVVRFNNTWFLDASGNGAWGAGDIQLAPFGATGDVYVTGDWNGNGLTEIGVVRNNKTWLLDASGNGAWGAGDIQFTSFGQAGDRYVTGDWNGNGTTKIGVVRNNNNWLLDASGNGVWGAGDLQYTFGQAGDRYVTGDWNGNGTTKIGVVRNNKTWLLDASGNGVWGPGDIQYLSFGQPRDVYVTGDWNGNGTTKIGVVRFNNTWLLDASGNGAWGAGDLQYVFGRANDAYVTGKWN
jgi:FtsP/CotA-like multicopper oxidase with cupredoxin domain